MGLEHLIVAWLLSNREKKRKKRQVIESAAVQREEKRQEQAVQQYLTEKGYDRPRQQFLTALAKSSLREDRREFSRILGRPYCEEDFAIEWAIRAIAEKEGWTFFRRDELIYDEEYCRLLGWLPPSREVIERFEEELTDLQRNEILWHGWVERNPKCWEVNISPEFYDSEEAFSLVVEYEHEKKQWK